MPAAPAYGLCGLCAVRQEGAGRPFLEARRGECFICEGMMQKVGSVAKLSVKEARRYDFRTFAVGVSIPDGVQEREDEVRANLKLKGRETIRTQASRMVADVVSAELGRRVDKMKPDLTLLADFVNRKVFATSKSLYYSGNYTKPPGVAQRRELCDQCGGSGCKRCGGSGFARGTSVEGLLLRRLVALTGGDKMVFTWLGSEDRRSRVYPPGRPFVVEVKSPRNRELPRRFVARFKGGQVAVSSGKVLPAKPVKLPAFRFRTRIFGLSASRVSSEGLTDLRSRFRNAEVRFERPHDRPTTKMVYKVAASTRGRSILIDAELDGGLPVKRFVSGDLVSPSVSEVLKTEVRCRNFDICRVWKKGEFEFAEITRVKEKD